MSAYRGETDPLQWAQAAARPSAGTILEQRRTRAGWLLADVAYVVPGWGVVDVHRVERGLDTSPASLERYARALEELADSPACPICHVQHDQCHPDDCAGHLLAVRRGQCS